MGVRERLRGRIWRPACAEAERIGQVRLARELAQKARLARELAQKARLARELAEKERLARELAEKERLALEQAEKPRVDQERVKQAATWAERKRAEQVAAYDAVYDAALLHKGAEQERGMSLARGLARIHVAVTAWKRYDYAERTLRSFAAWNGPTKFLLWYALDGGYDERLPALFNKYGFSCLVRHDGPNVGIARITDELVCAIGEHAEPDDLLLLLQDDWESVRPVPMNVVGAAFACEDIGALRLTGQFRERGNRRLTTSRGEHWEARVVSAGPGCESLPATSYCVRKIAGLPVAETVLVGRTNWAHPPEVTRMGLARFLLSPAGAERESIIRAERLRFLTAWVTEPVFWHIGGRTTKRMGGRQ